VEGAAALAKKTCPRCGSAYGPDAVFCPRDGARLEPAEAGGGPAADPYIGMIVAGDIELKSVAGAGAMGRVYRAHQTSIERDVAVKILHKELSGNRELASRFHREAKIASKLQHPHVVEVYLTGQLPDGAFFIVMEYLDGMSLASALAKNGGVFPLDRTVSVALQICDAVAEGHARGIVHRDLKPENVMLVRRGHMDDFVKVLDFGIAKVSLGDQSMETQAGLIFGTARYISPEGAQGATVGPQGDVYSIATILYQMLAGKTPFDAEQPVGLLIKHIHEPPPPLKALVPTIPDGIARIVMDNLAKDPKARAPNARVLGAALAAAAKDAQISISDVGVVARMSAVDLHLAPHPLDPTLDDAAAVQAPVAVPPYAPPKELARAPEPPRPPPPEPVDTPRERRSALPFVLLAFLLGAAIAVAVTEYVVNRRDVAHDDLVERTRQALADGHYVNPPGENVRDLVAAGLRRWPKDAELKKMRSDAEHEMVTMAMAARQSGDLIGARNLARDAYSLDSTDNSARFTRAQAEDELEGIANGTALKSGPPRLVFESPPLVKPGQKVEMSARIVVGAAGPHAKITNVRLTIFPNGQTTNPVPVTMTTGTDPSIVRATATAPDVGSYDVAFEANVDGTVVRAMRDLDVAR
jgi:serine/threonine-protein kinase